MLDAGRKKVKLGQLWAYARDDRPSGGNDPPAVVYCYASGRGSEHVRAHLEGFSGILQTDGYAAYKELVKTREASAPIVLSFCWAHLRRGFYKIAVGGNAPLAEDALRQIGALYKIEEQIRGQSAEQRQSARNARARPLVDAFKNWLDATLARVSGGSKLADVIRYAIRHWQGLVRFLDDGRIEINSNTVERSMRPIALTRNYAQVRIMRSCRVACADSSVDRPVRSALSRSSCT